MAVKFLNGVDVVGSMNIVASDVPNLDASKITSGTMAAARMPDISGTYLTTSAKAADSNLLDGLDSTSFLYNQVSQLANTDLDALSAQGIYHSGSSYSTNSNIPHANYFILANFTNDNDRQSQLWFGDTPTNFWWRPKQGASTWHPWEKVWTSSSFSSTNISNWNTAYGWGDHDGLYLPINNPTLTGVLTLPQHLKATGSNLSFSAGGNQILNIDLNGKIYPSTDNSTDLGFSTTGNRFRNGNFSGTVTTSGGNSGNWNTAYGWGNHASAQYATEAWVGEQNYATDDAIGNAISNLIDSSPANLDTLNELAAALGDDANFSTTVTNSIATKMPQGQQRTDINALINGAHRYDPSVNLPTNTHHAAITFGNNGNVTGQIATHFQTGELYSRGHNNSWSSWKKAWNDSNFSLTDVQNGVTAYGWGDHAAAGYAQGAFLPLAGGVITKDTASTEVLKFANNTVDGKIQIGFQANGSDGMHHRAYFKSYKSAAGNAAGKFDLIVRGAGGSQTSDVLELEAGEKAKWQGASLATETYAGSAADASAAVVNTRIDDEVLPAIPTNNTQLTNGEGYTTNTGTITGVSTGTGLDGTATSGAVTIALDLSELTDMTAAVTTSVDELILLDNGAERRKRFDEIFGSAAYQASSAFDAAGSAEAVNARIDNDVIPAIPTVPTTVSSFTNDSNYIAKGSTQPPTTEVDATKFQSSGDIANSSSGNHSLQVYSAINNDAFMAFHISGDYAVFFGLENASNRLHTGGWSAGAAKYQIFDTRDFSVADVGLGITAHGWGDHASAGYASGSFLGATAKAADSELLDGLDLHTGRNNLANKVVRTQASGYVEFGWINTTSGNTTNTITDIYVNTNDGYIRKATPAHFRSQITDASYDAAGSAATKLPLAGGTATGTIAAPSFDATTEVTVGPWAIRHNTGTGRLEFVLS